MEDKTKRLHKELRDLMISRNALRRLNLPNIQKYIELMSMDIVSITRHILDIEYEQHNGG